MFVTQESYMWECLLQNVMLLNRLTNLLTCKMTHQLDSHSAIHSTVGLFTCHTLALSTRFAHHVIDSATGNDYGFTCTYTNAYQRIRVRVQLASSPGHSQLSMLHVQH